MEARTVKTKAQGFVVLLVLLLSTLQRVCAPPAKATQTMPAVSLRRQILANYPAADFDESGVVDPGEVSNVITEVGLSMTITDVVTLDDRTGVLELAGQLTATWNDSNLHWNPVQWSGIRSLKLRASSIWLPIIQQENSPTRELIFMPQFGKDSLELVVANSNGPIIAVFDGFFKTRCQMDFRAYPFDVSVCTFTYKRFYDAHFVNLIPARGNNSMAISLSASCRLAQQAKTPPFPLWTMISVVEARHVNESGKVSWTVKLRRQAWREILQIFAPTSCLVTLQMLPILVMPSGISRIYVRAVISAAMTVFYSIFTASWRDKGPSMLLEFTDCIAVFCYATVVLDFCFWQWTCKNPNNKLARRVSVTLCIKLGLAALLLFIGFASGYRRIFFILGVICGILLIASFFCVFFIIFIGDANCSGVKSDRPSFAVAICLAFVNLTIFGLSYYLSDSLSVPFSCLLAGIALSAVALSVDMSPNSARPPQLPVAAPIDQASTEQTELTKS